jgi:hypothetical protein
MTAIPVLAQQEGCTQETLVGVLAAVLQTVAATVIPLLIEALLGGGTTALF